MSKEAMKLALEGAANYIDALGGDSRKYRQALAEQPAQQGCMRCNTPKKCALYGCSPLTWPAEEPAQQSAERGEPVQNNPFDCGVYLGSGKDYAIKHHVSYGPAQQEQNRQIDQLIQERDHRDEIIDKLCDAVLGPDRYEWSSQYFFEDAVREVEERMAEQPAQQEPVAWKLVPREPTHEMLKAMDECSTEGYDERLYAGHAASVYMAAVDAAPTPPAQPQQKPVKIGRITDNIKGMVLRQEVMLYTDDYLPIGTALYTSPPQRTWVGLTDEEANKIYKDGSTFGEMMRMVEVKLRIKNEDRN